MGAPSSSALPFWAVLLITDYLRHGRVRALAEIARDAGVDRTTLQRRVRSGTYPSATTVWRIARTVGLSMQDLGLILEGGGRVIIDLEDGTLRVEEAP